MTTAINIDALNDTETPLSDIDGWQMSVYLNPEDRSLEIHSGVGSIGTPMPAFHNRWMHVGGWDARCCEADVRSYYEHGDTQALLVALCDRYEGTEWDGSNHIGSWADCEREIALLDDYLVYAQNHDVRTFWDAGEWLCGQDDPTEEIRARVEAGETVEAIARSYVADNPWDVLVCESELARVIEGMVGVEA